MEKTMKRLLGLALALVMVLGMIPVSQLQVKADHVVDLETVNLPLDPTSTTCAACGKTNVTWVVPVEGEAQTPADGTHYYIPEGETVNEDGSKRYTITDGATVCIHLGTAESTFHGALSIMNGTVNLMGKGKLYRPNYEGRPIGMDISSQSTSTRSELNVYGGEIVGCPGATNMHGGSIFANGNTTTGVKPSILITGDAIVRDGKIAASANNYKGGNIFLKNATLTVDGGKIYGGLILRTSGNGAGGNVCVETGATLTVNGGEIYSGECKNTATGGGNIYVASGGTLDIQGGKIYNGKSSNAGGNIAVWGGGTATMSNGEVYNGTATGLGKSIFTQATTASLTITGGYLGGNNTSDATSIMHSRCSTSISGATIGKLKDGTSMTGNISMRNAELTLHNTNVYKSILNTEDASSNSNTQFRLSGTTTLDGNSYISRRGNAQLQILQGWEGSAIVSDSTMTGGSVTFGDVTTNIKAGTVAQDGTFTPGDVAYTGTLMVGSGVIPEKPHVVLTDDTTDAPGTMAVASYQLLDLSEGTLVKWTTSLNDFDKDQHAIKLTNQTAVELPSDAVVDVYGNDVTFTATAPVELSLVDSKNDSYDETVCGSVTAGTKVTLKRDVTAANGNRYVTIDNDDNTVSAHRVSMELTGVSLSTAQVGYAYQAQYKFDGVVENNIVKYGIAANVNATPAVAQDGTFTAGTGYTAVNNANTALTSGGTVEGHAITNILKGSADDDTRGKTKVFANPYISIDAGAQTVNMVADTANAGTSNGIAFSLYDILNAIDKNWTSFTETEQQQVNDFADKWDATIASWNFQEIGK